MQSSASLPVHLTSVGCYGSEEKLIDCGHHKYATSFVHPYFPGDIANPSMDISISCLSSVDNSSSVSSVDSTSSGEVNSVSTVSLIVSVISASALTVVVAVLIIVVFRQRTIKR